MDEHNLYDLKGTAIWREGHLNMSKCVPVMDRATDCNFKDYFLPPLKNFRLLLLSLLVLL